MKSKSNISASEIGEIINKCEICHVAMVDPNAGPYVLPFNFVYRDGKIYIHSGPKGKKIEIWKTDNRVCIAFSSDYEMRIQNPEVACSYSMRYRSVLVYGRVEKLEALDDKGNVLNMVMQKYAKRGGFSYSKPALDNVNVFEIEIEKVEGRTYGY